jgi:transcriptional regulator with XRE-family HTH domain
MTKKRKKTKEKKAAKKRFKNLAQAIRTLREEKGWTQAQLAKKARLSLHTISNTERNVSLPKFPTVTKIAKAFKMTEWAIVKQVRLPRNMPKPIQDLFNIFAEDARNG